MIISRYLPELTLEFQRAGTSTEVALSMTPLSQNLPYMIFEQIETSLCHDRTCRISHSSARLSRTQSFQGVAWSVYIFQTNLLFPVDEHPGHRWSRVLVFRPRICQLVLSIK